MWLPCIKICYTKYEMIHIYAKEGNYIMLSIVEVRTKAQRKKFIQFQNQLYRNCPQYVPTMLSDELANLNPKVNPAFDYCDMRFFLAYRDGEIVGRIGGILSHKANDKWSVKYMRITRIDFIDDIEVSSLLIKTIEDWGRQEGMTHLIGPIGFCDLDKEGMLVKGFEEPSLFITYYNYPYYVEHFEKLGFQKDVDWIESRIYVKCLEKEKIARICQRVMDRHKLRYVQVPNKRKVKPYIKKVFELVNSEFDSLYGEVPLSERQMQYYAKQFVQLLNLQYLGIIEREEDGKMVGLGLLAPSLAEPMRKCGGRLFPFGWIPLLRTIHNPKVLDMYFVAVDGEYRKLGVPAVLMHHITEIAEKNGVRYAETGPELETNYAVQSMWTGYEAESKYKRRRCFIREISAQQ